MRGH
jgi:hypothetical protein